VAHSVDKARAVSFMSRYLNVSGHDAVYHRVVVTFGQCGLTKLTDCSNPILLNETDNSDSHSASFLDHKAVYALRVLPRLLVDDVGKEPWESA